MTESAQPFADVAADARVSETPLVDKGFASVRPPRECHNSNGRMKQAWLDIPATPAALPRSGESSSREATSQHQGCQAFSPFGCRNREAGVGGC